LGNGKLTKQPKTYRHAIQHGDMTTTTETAPKTTAEKLVYTIPEVLEILGTSRCTLWRLGQKGLLRPIHGMEGRYSRKSIEKFIDREVLT
jgi:predicted DNA-binding transcriptional regulator AlpA